MWKAGVQLGQRAERAASQDVVARDRDLPLAPALPGRTVRGEHIDGEPVMLGERRRRRMQRAASGQDLPDGEIVPDRVDIEAVAST